MKYLMFYIRILFINAVLFLNINCVKKHISIENGLGSFEVILTRIDSFEKPDYCVSDYGSKDCPRPFAEKNNPVSVDIEVKALDRYGDFLNWSGTAFIDLRQGRFFDLSLTERHLEFVEGYATKTLFLIEAQGEMRIWVEDCGNSLEKGSFSTGVSSPIYFESPRIDQVNQSITNDTSLLIPRADNVCVISGDPRYGFSSDEDTGEILFTGFSHGGTINSPPVAIGIFIELEGCSMETYLNAKNQGESCAKGPLVVTSITDNGFYVSDIHVDSIARGKNHLFVFNFNFPEDLMIGDFLITLKGSPVEFAGTTQLTHPIWVKDTTPKIEELVPKPIELDLEEYIKALRTWGRNDSSDIYMEKLENALVCVDNIAPGKFLKNCDNNNSGSIERSPSDCPGELFSVKPYCCTDENTPNGCGLSDIKIPPFCDELTAIDYCFPLTLEEKEACDLTYNALNPDEVCCERLCYSDIACVEDSAYITYGQWTANTEGIYEPNNNTTRKIAFITRNANPDFDPFEFAKTQAKKTVSERQHLRIVGNLRHVLAARPPWVIIARNPSDIQVQEVSGGCDTLR